ncbi:hypothetical protein [Vreelandella venusta]|uniref:hypothetical protein n=1 Tax=Vreelandella venusta TaxID=44935 RepID=UPI0018DA6CE6|nr:hypothetical protein [Halomonas venusta]QPI62413.1 hypothetical protein IR195_10930 [Halomonas venusta]
MNYREGLIAAKANGIAYITYEKRVNSYGWDIKKAATKPARKLGHVKALLEEHGITKAQFYHWRKSLPVGTSLRDIAEVAAARSRAREVEHG